MDRIRERSYHHGDVRRQLISAAIESLREHGPDGLSLRDLSKRIGVSYGAPQRHFPHKQSFVEAVALRGYDLLSEELAGLETSESDPFEVCLTAIVQVVVHFVANNTELFHLMVSAGRNASTPELAATFKATWAAGPALIHKGQQEGHIREGDPEEYFQMLYSVIVGVTTTDFRGMVDVRDRVTLMERTVRVVLRGLRSDRPL